MSKFKHLESPMTIRGKVYKNRLIAAPTLFAHSVFFLPEISGPMLWVTAGKPEKWEMLSTEGTRQRLTLYNWAA